MIRFDFTGPRVYGHEGNRKAKNAVGILPATIRTHIHTLCCFDNTVRNRYVNYVFQHSLPSRARIMRTCKCTMLIAAVNTAKVPPSPSLPLSPDALIRHTPSPPQCRKISLSHIVVPVCAATDTQPPHTSKPIFPFQNPREMNHPLEHCSWGVRSGRQWQYLTEHEKCI